MKKILLITVIGTLFAAATAFGHCGSCGVGDEAHATVKECASECSKACCAKACCAKEAKKCKDGCKKACCAKPEKACASDCAKPCCAKPAVDETATKVKATGACCAAKAGEPA